MIKRIGVFNFNENVTSVIRSEFNKSKIKIYIKSQTSEIEYSFLKHNE